MLRNKLTIYYLAMALVVPPVLYAFSFFNLRLPIPSTSALAYFFLIISIAFFILVNEVKIINFVVFIAGLALFLLNFLAASNGSVSWTLNWSGFLYIGFVIYQLLSRMSDLEANRLSKIFFSLNAIIFTLIFLSLAFVYWQNSEFIFVNLINGEFNQVIALFHQHLGLYKQYFGILAAVLISIGIVNSASASISKFIIILLIMAFAPIVLGIRTLHLATVLTFLAYWSMKSVYVRFVIMLAALSLGYLILVVPDTLHTFLVDKFDRMPLYYFAFSLLDSYPFGLGLGGYKPYVDENQLSLFSQYADMLVMIRFPNAPESDVVFFVASFGFLSILPLAFLSWLSIKSLENFQNSKLLKLNPLERVLMLTAPIIVFMGITEDYTGSLVWWIYMSSALAILSRTSNKFLNSRVDNEVIRKNCINP